VLGLNVVRRHSIRDAVRQAEGGFMGGSGRCRVLGVLSILVFCLASSVRAESGLLDLYLKAREYDPVFLQARLQREISRQILRESRAGVMPVVTADAELTYNDQNIRESPSLTPQTVDSDGDGFPDTVVQRDNKIDYYATRYTLTLTQPVYRAEALRRIPQSRAEVRQKEAEYEAAEQALMVRIAEALLNALLARDNLEFATAERAAIERQLQESEQRLGSGLGTITDVHDARARFADAQAREIEVENALSDSLLAIAEITGEIPSDLRSLSESFPLAEPDRPEIDAWVRTALFQNLTLRARQEEAQIAEQEVRVKKAARLPSLDLVASLIASDSDATVVGDVATDSPTDIRNGSLALRLGIPIFDGGVLSAETRVAVLQHQAKLQELELERRRVERQTRTAFLGVVGSISRASALAQAVFSQERTLESKTEGFQSGLETGLAVLDARRDLFFSRKDYSQARYTYVLNSLRLKAATGTLSVQDLRLVNAHLE
jgi:outer membrane protein